MFMYMYKNIYKYIFMSVFTSVFLCFCMHMYIYTYIYVCFSFVHVCINECVCTYVYIYACLYVYMSVFLCVCFFTWFHIIAFVKGHHSFIKFGILRNTPTGTPEYIISDVLPKIINVSGPSTSYTFNKVTHLVSISHQHVIRNLTTEKKSQKIP